MGSYFENKAHILKAASINKSWLETSFRFHRLVMNGKFDVYLLWPFKEKLIS